MWLLNCLFFLLIYSGSIIRVLQFLDKSLEHSEHTHHDFYASELAGCLSRLAGHNSNKTIVSLLFLTNLNLSAKGLLK